jgi:predicted transcriptional regulator
MQIMVEKGLVTRDESARTHVYQAAQEEESTQSCLLDDLLQKAFQGSAKSLVVRALSKAGVGDGELDEIQAFLDQLKETRK